MALFIVNLVYVVEAASKSEAIMSLSENHKILDPDDMMFSEVPADLEQKMRESVAIRRERNHKIDSQIKSMMGSAPFTIQ